MVCACGDTIYVRLQINKLKNKKKTKHSVKIHTYFDICEASKKQLQNYPYASPSPSILYSTQSYCFI